MAFFAKAGASGGDILRSLKIAGLAILIAAPVSAQQIAKCAFTMECIEGESCEETSFDLSVAYGGPESDQWAPVLIVTDAETLSAHRNPQLDGFVALGGSAGQSVLLSTDENGARYTVHLNAAEMSITYTGMCEVN